MPGRCVQRKVVRSMKAPESGHGEELMFDRRVTLGWGRSFSSVNRCRVCGFVLNAVVSFFLSFNECREFCRAIGMRTVLHGRRSE